jgi:hypothetical protein
MEQPAYKDSVSSVVGDVVSTSFVLEGNESVFQMLTQGVYNDPILAVMREWSTNACDACIAADLPVHYDVHIPTTSAPVFYTRDYGTGLHPEDVVGLFSTLGASTKRHSKKLNGTFGIGRMAGLAVGDAFTIESYIDGKVHMYTISMQKGLPVTLHLGSQDTNEPNGLKLSVSVDYKDIDTYRSKVSELYKYFDYKPNLNIEGINITLDSSEHISDDWYVKPVKEHNNYRSSNWVLMSQVIYEIPYNSVIKDGGFKNLVIKAESGAVSINPGRESLSLDSKTVDYLNNRLKQITDEYVEIGKSLLASAKDDRSLVETYSKLTSSAPPSVVAKLDAKPFFSKEMQTMIVANNYYYSSLGYVEVTDAFKKETNNNLTITYKQTYYKTARPLNNNNSEALTSFFTCDHVIVDLKTKFRSALNKQFSGKNVMIWQRSDKSVEVEDATAEATKFLKAIGIPFQLASSLIDVEEVQASTKAPRKGFYASAYTGEAFTSGCKIAEENYTKGEYLYVKLKNTTPILEDSSMSMLDYILAYKFLMRCDGNTPRIMGVAKKYQETANSLDNWIDFETYIKDKCKGMVLNTGTTESPCPIQDHLKVPLCSEATMYNFPKDLQEYLKEHIRHQRFIKGKDFVQGSLKEVLKNLGTLFVEYKNSASIDIPKLKSKYPHSIPMITGEPYRYGLHMVEKRFILDIAKLEEFYELHSDKQ